MSQRQRDAAFQLNQCTHHLLYVDKKIFYPSLDQFVVVYLDDISHLQQHLRGAHGEPEESLPNLMGEQVLCQVGEVRVRLERGSLLGPCYETG